MLSKSKLKNFKAVIWVALLTLPGLSEATLSCKLLFDKNLRQNDTASPLKGLDYLAVDDFPFFFSKPVEIGGRYGYIHESHYYPNMEDLKLKNASLRRLMIQTQLNQRERWRIEDSKNQKPYSFEDLVKRNIPLYSDGIPGKLTEEFIGSIDFPLADANGGSIPSIEDLSEAGEPVFRVGNRLDMNSWSPSRFPDKPLRSRKIITINSPASSRTRFLQPEHLESVKFGLFEISKLHEEEVALSTPPKLDESDSYNQSFSTAFRNTLDGDFLRLAEVQGIPVLVGKKLDVNDLTGLPLWTNTLLELSRNWNLFNPEYQFSVGKDHKGEYRVIFPLFKIFSPFENYPQNLETILAIDSQLQLTQDSLTVGSQKPRKILGRLLTYRYLAAQFGLSKARFIFFGIDHRQGLKDSKENPLNQEGGTFKYKNLIRAHILAQFQPEIIQKFLNELVNQKRYSDWFEIAYWINKPEVQMRSRHLRRMPIINLSFSILTDKQSSLKAIDWVSPKGLRKHFRKHGENEMGFDSPENYLSSAIEFFGEESQAQIALVRSKGLTIAKYNFETREFGLIDKNGMIITYYRLTEDYRTADEFHDYLGEDILNN